MNAAGRKVIKEMIEQLTEMSGTLEEVAVEEREKYDNMPEGLQMSEKGEALERSAEALECAFAGSMGELIGYLEEAIE